MVVAVILKNIKKLPYLGRCSSDFYEIWPDDTLHVHYMYGPQMYTESANSWGQALGVLHVTQLIGHCSTSTLLLLLCLRLFRVYARDSSDVVLHPRAARLRYKYIHTHTYTYIRVFLYSANTFNRVTMRYGRQTSKFS